MWLEFLQAAFLRTASRLTYLRLPHPQASKPLALIFEVRHMSLVYVIFPENLCCCLLIVIKFKMENGWVSCYYLEFSLPTMKYLLPWLQNVKLECLDDSSTVYFNSWTYSHTCIKLIPPFSPRWYQDSLLWISQVHGTIDNCNVIW